MIACTQPLLRHRRHKHRGPGHWFGRDLRQAKEKCVEAVRLFRSDPEDRFLEEKARLARRHYERLLRKAQSREFKKNEIAHKDTVKFRGLSLVYDYWFSDRVNRTKAKWRAAAAQACERVIRNRLYMMKHESYLHSLSRRWGKPGRRTRNASELWWQERDTKTQSGKVWTVRLRPFHTEKNLLAQALLDAAADELKLNEWPRNGWWALEGPGEVDHSVWTAHRPCPECGRSCLRLMHAYKLVEDSDRIDYMWLSSRCGAQDCLYTPTVAELVYPMIGRERDGTCSVSSVDQIDRLYQMIERS